MRVLWRAPTATSPRAEMLSGSVSATTMSCRKPVLLSRTMLLRWCTLQSKLSWASESSGWAVLCSSWEFSSLPFSYTEMS